MKKIFVLFVAFSFLVVSGVGPALAADLSGASASSTDPATGVTTTSVGQADGSRVVTKTDRDGNVISQERMPAAGAPRPGAGGPRAPIPTDVRTDPDSGITTTVYDDGAGGEIRVYTDRNGNEIGRGRVSKRELDRQQRARDRAEAKKAKKKAEKEARAAKRAKKKAEREARRRKAKEEKEARKAAKRAARMKKKMGKKCP